MITMGEWWARRWWDSATQAEREAMRALVAGEAPPDAGQAPLTLIDKNDLFGASDRTN